MDGIVYGATLGLGFANLENLAYVFDGGMAVAVVRALTAVPGHALLGAIMGAYVGTARFASPQMQSSLLLRAIVYPVALHACYDAGVTFGSFAIVVLVLIGEAAWCRSLMKRIRGAYQATSLFARVSSEGKVHRRTPAAWTKISLALCSLAPVP